MADANDVIAHEMTHAVTDATANLDYRFQPGAINESYSDIFGAMVDRNDWLMGEDLPDGAIRSLSNPPAYDQPDHMSDYVSKPITDDHGAVHTNSGIPNKAAWLIGNGGTHYKNNVGGIGKTKLEHIYYRTLTTRLTSTSDFDTLRRETQQECNDLIGQFGITDSDCVQVRLAFISVGITPKVIIGESSDHTPALAYFNGRFYIAWTERDSDHYLNVMSSGDGVSWGNKAVFSVGRSDDGPSLLVAQNELRLSWSGRGQLRRLQWILLE